jgi:hypothetical protein
MKHTLTVAETAELFGVAQDSLRRSIQSGKFPFGIACPSTEGQGYRYYISKRKVCDFLGITEEECDTFVGREKK